MTASRERRLILSAWEVRAILDGSKTQIRRPIDLSRVEHPVQWVGWSDDQECGLDWWAQEVLEPIGFEPPELIDGTRIRCPFGAPGDRLWVAEAFALEDDCEAGPYDPPHKDGRPIKRVGDESTGGYWIQPHYRATDPEPQLVDARGGENPAPNWSSPAVMPRWASRIILEVVDVRAQRLQDITEEDAEAEGHAWTCGAGSGHPDDQISPLEQLQAEWNERNRERFPWASNPWTFAATVRRLEAA
jgi:hypothetical protein